VQQQQQYSARTPRPPASGLQWRRRGNRGGSSKEMGAGPKEERVEVFERKKKGKK